MTLPTGLRVALMTDEIGWHTRQLQRALRARGGVGRCLDLADCEIDTRQPHGLLLPGYGRSLPDAVLVRGIAGGSFEQVTKRLSVLHALQALGVPVYNEPRAIERSVDKAMTSWLLHHYGLPTPATWVGEDRARARRELVRAAAAGHGLVSKPLFGSQGKGLARVGRHGDHFEALPERPAGVAGPAGLHYLQRFLPAAADGAPGHDWRVLVIGGRAVAAMRRVSAHWIHNVAQGAQVEPAALTPELATLAEAATAALGLDYAGVDLMPVAEAERRAGLAPIQILEVNGVAAWRGLQKVTPFDIAQALVDDLIDRKLAAARAGRPPAAPAAPAGPALARRA